MQRDCGTFIIYSTLLGLIWSQRQPRGARRQERLYQQHLGRRISLPEILKTVYMVTPLTSAASQGRLNIFKTLFSDNAHLNSQNTQGHTPLLWAIKNNQEVIVEWLIKKGADCNLVSDSDADTPLLNAVRVGNPAIVELLLQAAADVNFTQFSPGDDLFITTPLLAAIKK
jgi:ankyrin repeat protein